MNWCTVPNQQCPSVRGEGRRVGLGHIRKAK